jgi:hypothetical protein
VSGQFKPAASCLHGAGPLVEGADLNPLLVGEQRYVDGAGDMVLLEFEGGSGIDYKMGVEK